ncbi:hypothetical protein CRUP_025688 [Coryphaenoides rupestris]|nr:hypothetical protein CRUP_025688 [Coryphaenoides rupestris]
MEAAAAAAVVLDVNAEAKRILAVSIGKLYASRSQRGGPGLHRSLLLSLVMRSARDIYHLHLHHHHQLAAAEEEAMDTSKHAEEEAGSTTTEPEKLELECSEGEGGEEDTMKAEVSCPRTDTRRGEDKKEEKEKKEDKENMNPRKRRGKASVAPDFLPSKKARLEEEEEQPEEEKKQQPGEERHQGPVVVPGGLGAASCRVADKTGGLTADLDRPGQWDYRDREQAVTSPVSSSSSAAGGPRVWRGERPPRIPVGDPRGGAGVASFWLAPPTACPAHSV